MLLGFGKVKLKAKRSTVWFPLRWLAYKGRWCQRWTRLWANRTLAHGAVKWRSRCGSVWRALTSSPARPGVDARPLRLRLEGWQCPYKMNSTNWSKHWKMRPCFCGSGQSIVCFSRRPQSTREENNTKAGKPDFLTADFNILFHKFQLKKKTFCLNKDRGPLRSTASCLWNDLPLVLAVLVHICVKKGWECSQLV